MNKMYTQNFQEFFYGFYCFHSADGSDSSYYNFSSETDVETLLQSIATPFSQAEAATIYTDPQYGMNSAKTMTYWVAASLAARSYFTLSGAGSESYLVLQAHYASLVPSIEITDSQMDQIVANGSVIDGMILTLEARLIDNPTKTKYTDLSDPITPNPLAMV